MNNKKNTWGGARPNSGPKRKTEDRLDIKIYMRASEKEQQLIKENAEKKNISVAQYIREAVLKELNI